ncbi:MAG: signal peptidase I [Synechocystis sp.]
MTKKLTQESPNKEKTPLQEKSHWRELIETVITAVILAVGIRAFVAEARYIPSSSMEETLPINDRLIIEKVSYRLHEPERRDIVVFYAPPTAAICNGGLSAPPPKDAFIKRIIGVPGDKVEFKNAQVLINGQVLNEPYIVQDSNNPAASETLVPLNSVLLPKGMIPDNPTQGFVEQPVQVTIPQGSYLVMGDNRNNSCDSRYWGFVPRENLIGKAFVRFWPFSRLGVLANPSANGPTDVIPQAVN